MIQTPHLRILLAAALIALAGCVTAPELPPSPAYDAATLRRINYRAVVVAGDASIRAFDNAADRLATSLASRGLVKGELHRFSARPAADRPRDVELATVSAVLDAITTLRPAPGQGCLVYATAHGAADRGLFLPANGADPFLTPDRLDRALALGCGNAPTLVILSGCYAGTYLRPPMTRANRAILTAARPDRTSFGCGAGNQFTEFDNCMISALETERGPIAAAFATTRACVTAREQQLRVQPSEPQAWWGEAVPTIALP